jgi:hypothetical protein
VCEKISNRSLAVAARLRVVMERREFAEPAASKWFDTAAFRAAAPFRVPTMAACLELVNLQEQSDQGALQHPVVVD